MAAIGDGGENSLTGSSEGSRGGGKLSWNNMTADDRRPFLEAIARHIWPTWKMLGDSPKDQEIFIDKMCKLMNDGGIADRADELAWKHRNGNACVSALNTTRSNTCNQMKAQVESWYKLHDRKMPSLARLQAIATRTILLTENGDAGLQPDANGVVDTIEATMELFIWWWDTLLPSATAPATNFWAPEQRWYNHIYDGKAGDELLITPQDEAFAILAMENYYARWENDFKAKLDHPGKKLVKPKSKDFTPPTDPESVARGYVIQENTIVKFGPKWKTKYTLDNAGSSLNGGWTTAGKEKYLKLKKHVAAGRRLPTTPMKEALVLQAIRDKNGVEGENYDQYLQAKKRARTGNTVVEGLSLLEETEVADGEEDEMSALTPIQIAEI